MRRAAGFIDRFEENSIALLLAAMTLVSFSQVIARYVFNSGWTGALELTRILFAWLILFGMSYGIKVGAHLGVDAFVRLLPKRLFRLTAIFAAVCTLLYALILLKSDWLRLLGIDAKGGAFDYWFRMFKLGIGLDDLRFPVWMQETFGLQERVHRWIAYLILPVGLVLLAFRTIEALVAILRGKRELIIAAHEGETLVGQSVVVADHPESRE